jgi:hypothetical protein
MKIELKIHKVGFIAAICIICFGTVHSCKHEEKGTGTDKELYDMAVVATGFTWYKNSAVKLDKSAGSGHAQPFLNTRYNAVAATQLDSSGKVKPGAVFPNGSLIVKELYDKSGRLERYAILYKSTGHKDADSKGWVWGYINYDGSVSEPASRKGSICINCHSQINSIDYMLMNKFFP